MEGHGPDEVQGDQDRDDGCDDYGGDEPAPATCSTFGAFFLIGVRVHASSGVPADHDDHSRHGDCQRVREQ
jgi:hypothetical protein